MRAADYVKLEHELVSPFLRRVEVMFCHLLLYNFAIPLFSFQSSIHFWFRQVRSDLLHHFALRKADQTSSFDWPFIFEMAHDDNCSLFPPLYVLVMLCFFSGIR